MIDLSDSEITTAGRIARAGCGFGRVWSRLATDQADAEAIAAAWKAEGLPQRMLALGIVNGGEFRIEASR